MIRDGKRLPPDVISKVPVLVETIGQDQDVVALYAFGSLASGELKPLSDLDFGILLSESLDRQARARKGLDLIGIFNSTFKTDEVDLVILNGVPLRFAYNIFKNGRLLFCRDRSRLSDFIEKSNKRYLDFKPVQEAFDKAFLKGLGYNG